MNFFRVSAESRVSNRCSLGGERQPFGVCFAPLCRRGSQPSKARFRPHVFARNNTFCVVFMRLATMSSSILSCPAPPPSYLPTPPLRSRSDPSLFALAVHHPRVDCPFSFSFFFFSQSGPYPWAIVSDPLKAFLFILVRDPDKFSGSKTEKVVLAKVKKLGFTSSWNSPRKTVQEGCSYTPEPDASAGVVAEGSADAGAAAAAAEKPALSSLLKLRGGAFGVGGPLHASCKVRGSSRKGVERRGSLPT